MNYNLRKINFIRNHHFRDTNGDSFSCPLDLRWYSNFDPFEHFENLNLTYGNTTI